MSQTFAPTLGTKVAENLVNVLSDTYVLAIKTHACHWNMTDKMFPQLHEMFGKQYQDLLTAAIGITERVREIDIAALGHIANYMEDSARKDAPFVPQNPQEIIKDLLKAHETMRKELEKVCDLANDIKDESSEDLMIERMLYHDEVIGLLRAAAA
jgi:starvation-inducible DNA-binding protein